MTRGWHMRFLDFVALPATASKQSLMKDTFFVLAVFIAASACAVAVIAHGAIDASMAAAASASASAPDASYTVGADATSSGADPCAGCSSVR